jgi:hypothetical protein
MLMLNQFLKSLWLETARAAEIPVLVVSLEVPFDSPCQGTIGRLDDPVLSDL